MKPALLLSTLVMASAAFGQTSACSFENYKEVPGVKAEMRGSALTLLWNGESGHQLRAVLAVEGGKPVVEELAARKANGRWIVLGQKLTPEYQVTTGRRRLSEQQMAPLRKLGIELTPEVVAREQWNAFWDAPLNLPGVEGASVDLPRRKEEIRTDWASFHATGCSVKTDGARVEVTLPGVDLGIFSGDLRYTVYSGSNLLRQEVIAKTDQPFVAYKYVAGLKGFEIRPKTKVIWKDVARDW